MPRTRTTYTPDFKAKVVIEVIQGEKELNAIAASYNLNPNMVRTWKKEFLENAGRVWSEYQVEKDIKKKEAALEEERNTMLKTIGQLTLERDFLQDCFRKSGTVIPDVHKSKL